MTFSELLLCSNQNELIYFLPLFLVIFYWIDLRSLETRKQPQIENLVKSTGKRFPSEWSKMLKETLKGQFLFRNIEQITKFSDDQVNKKKIDPYRTLCVILPSFMSHHGDEFEWIVAALKDQMINFLPFLTGSDLICGHWKWHRRKRENKKKITSTTGL